MVPPVKTTKWFAALPFAVLLVSLLGYFFLSSYDGWLRASAVNKEASTCVPENPCLYADSVRLRIIVIAFNRPESLQSPALASVEEGRYSECSVEFKHGLDADVSSLPD
ncbi:hypothetical protein LSAT2_020010, partial [Lamellibrachia satsuma]